MVQLHFLNALPAAQNNKSVSDLPTFLISDGIKGYLSLDSSRPHGLEAQIRITGVLSLSAASTMASYGAIDLKYSNVDSRTVLDYKQRLAVRGDVMPFHLEAPSSMVEASNFPATLRTSSANIETDLDLGYASLPLMIAAVTYTLEVTVSRLGTEESKFSQEVRLLNNSVDLSEFMRAKEAVAQSTILKTRRLSSFGRISPPRSTTENNITIEMATPKALSFDARSDAAATKMSFTVTVKNDPSKNKAPTSMKTTIGWNLESATDVVMSSEVCDSEEASLVLRKRYPVQKKSVKCDYWKANRDPSTNAIISWSSENSFWITEPLDSFLTPTFYTPYLSHTYSLNLQMKAEKTNSFKVRKAELNFEMPITVSYERGSLPTYAASNTPPQYNTQPIAA